MITAVPADERTIIRRFAGIVAVADIMLLLLPLASTAYAAAGDLDPSFGVGGRVTRDITSRRDVPWTTASQADGKIVVAGESGLGGSNPGFVVARTHSDGSLDMSFGGDGKVTTDFTAGEDVAYSVAVQADGKIVTVGTAGFEMFALARYDPDGSLDTGFGGDGKVTTDFTSHEDFAFIVAIQADGKIVAGGDAGGRNPKWALARYNPDGSLDGSFGGDGKVTTDFAIYPEDLLALAIQPDGRIVAAGGDGFGAPNENFALARYDPDGSLDTSFSGDGKLTTDFTSHPDVVFNLALQADGKIVAAGGSALGRSNPKWALARYNIDGSLDTTFSADGKLTTDFTRGDDDAYGITLQADGKIVAAGQAGLSDAKFALARYNPDGSLDANFSGDGTLTTNFTEKYDAAYGVFIQADGKILAAGVSGCCGTRTKLALARYLAA
jgi:uncharacterized delta-60 repeat protein